MASKFISRFSSKFVVEMHTKLAEDNPHWKENTIKGVLVHAVRKIVHEIKAGGLQQIQWFGDSASREVIVVQKFVAGIQRNDHQVTSESTSTHFNEILWMRMWHVTDFVLRDMETERIQEKMKSFLQMTDVEEVGRYAKRMGMSEDKRRNHRFSWARHQMDESDFIGASEYFIEEMCKTESNVTEGEMERINYKVYGPTSEWSALADEVIQFDEVMWPSQKPRTISNDYKHVINKLVTLKETHDPTTPLGHWKNLVQPSRIDWLALLQILKEKKRRSYFKIAEYALHEESFRTNIHDYSNLAYALGKEHRLKDAQRILKKMNEDGFLPDSSRSAVWVPLFIISGYLYHAKQAFESVKINEQDMKLNSLITAYVDAGEPQVAKSLIEALELTREIYDDLLRFMDGGAGLISTSISMEYFCPESWAFMVDAYLRARDRDLGRRCFDQMMKFRDQPSLEKCIASAIASYVKENLLDEGISLVLELEKMGYQLDISTYAVVIDGLVRMELFADAQQILEKIKELDEAPINLHISVCEMHIKSKTKTKALETLEVLYSKIEQFKLHDFERLISVLSVGGFTEDARRIHDFMEAQGFLVID